MSNHPTPSVIYVEAIGANPQEVHESATKAGRDFFGVDVDTVFDIDYTGGGRTHSPLGAFTPPPMEGDDAPPQLYVFSATIALANRG